MVLIYIIWYHMDRLLNALAPAHDFCLPVDAEGVQIVSDC